MDAAHLMTKAVATCRTSHSLNRAAQLMWERRVGCIPVVDHGDRVVGVLTDRDVCMAAYTQGRRLDDIAVTTAMASPVLSCSPSATAEEIEDLMMAHGVRRLVVVDADGRLQGLVALDDLARTGATGDKGEIDLERVAVALGEIARHTSPIEGRGRNGRVVEGDLAELVRNSLAALRALRAEIRVDIHLAGAELRGRWRRLEARMRAAEMRARETRSEGAHNLAALLESARQLRARLRAKPASDPTVQPR